jgi:hypothetical protein
MLTNQVGIQGRGECSEQTQLYPLSNERHFRDVLEPAVPAPSSSAAWGGGRREVCLLFQSQSSHDKPLTARLQLLISAPAGGFVARCDLQRSMCLTLASMMSLLPTL